MLKKHFIFSFLTFAYSMVVAHSVIPHHHHATEEELAQHHQTDHHHGDESSNSLSHILSHIIHSADGFTTLNNHNISKIFSRQLLLTVAVLSENFSLDDVLIPPLLHKPSAEHPVYSSPHSLASGLRAPPSFIA